MGAPGDGGAYGRWGTDGLGLPCFDLDPGVFLDPSLVLPKGGARELWHQVGNDRLTATAHAGGRVALYASEGGWVLLDGGPPRRTRGSCWNVSASGRTLLSSLVELPRSVHWGTGYAEWSYSGLGFDVTRRVTAPFGEVPALVVELTVCAPEPSWFTEHWAFIPYPLIPGPLMSERCAPPSTHTAREKSIWRLMFLGSSSMRRLTETARRAAGRLTGLSVSRQSSDPPLLVLAPRRSALPRGLSFLPRLQRDVFFAALDAPGARIQACSVPGGTEACFSIPLKEGEQTFSFAVGLARHGEASAVLEALDVDGGHGLARWAETCSLRGGPSALEREATWHAYYLKSAKVTDDRLGPYIPQGSAYGFIHGVQGAPRDYALCAVPLTYIDPESAAQLLRLTMRMTRADGSMHYAHSGAGVIGPDLVHPFPTDLPLFLLWALTEYTWATEDAAFAAEVVPFCDGGASTVLERALLAWRHIRGAVGTGPHGMLRVGSGDWSDPLGLMTADRSAFARNGESAFNTAMGAYVLPRAAELLESAYPDQAAEMRSFASGLRSAMGEAWQGRWFLRGWDGRGNPIGESHLFLDSQAWCLVARIGSEERRASLVRDIHELCEAGSPIGATILDRPHRVTSGILPAGWDCNGGVWAAIDAFLAWGYSLHDPELTLECLNRQTLAAHASAYPRVWFGVWSGPDAYNSHLGDRPGQTFTHPATPMQEFPVMNSNAHAGPLLALLKVLGIGATPSGIRVSPRLPESFGDWRLVTPLVQIECVGGEVQVHRSRGQL